MGSPNSASVTITKAQINRLGLRLSKAESPSESDLRTLNNYRLSFDAAYQIVVNKIKNLRLQVTGRPAKTTHSIVEKLRRERTRLTRMQDIAGCRIVVDNIVDQDCTLVLLCKEFPEAKIMDRRLHPSHGYRAVHLIVEVDEKSVEIQLRTKLQHLWAEYSEKCSDVIDPALKYGGGHSEAAKQNLVQSSKAASALEEQEKQIGELLVTREELQRGAEELVLAIKQGSYLQDASEELKEQRIREIQDTATMHDKALSELREVVQSSKEELAGILLRSIAQVQKPKGT